MSQYYVQSTGSSSAVTTIDGNSGYVTGTTITLTTGSSNANGTALFTGNDTTTMTVTFSDSNGNTCLGTSSLSSLSGGTANTSLGYESLKANTSGGANTCVGYEAGIALTSGGKNTLLGSIAGQNYTSSESNNICIGNNVTGTAAESYITRIGNTTGSSTAGDINKCFIQGIYGQASSGFTSPLPVFVDSSNGQLGYGSIVSTWTTSSATTINPLVSNTNYVLTGSSAIGVTLPASPALYDALEIVVNTTQIVTITINSGQTLRFGQTAYTTSLANSLRGDVIKMRCTTSGSSAVWIVESGVGNWSGS